MNALNLHWGDLEVVHFPSGNTGPSGHRSVGPRLQQNDPDASTLAGHAFVLGSGQSVSSNSTVSAQARDPFELAIKLVPTQGPLEPETSCLGPRVTAIQKQGFSDQVAARIEVPQRNSTRSVCESKWSIFVKWCESSQMDFRSASINSFLIFSYICYRRKISSQALQMAIKLL